MRKQHQQNAHQIPAIFKLDEVLEALDPEKRKDCIHQLLEMIGEKERAQFKDALLKKTAASKAKWRPKAPPSQLPDEVKRFVATAIKEAYANPSKADEYLRAGIKASLAGDHPGARAIFESLLPAIARGDIKLDQDEPLERVLSVDLKDVAARYLGAVYLTTPVLGERVKAIREALNTMTMLVFIANPITDMQKAVGRKLPEINKFLPAWLKLLEQEFKKSVQQ